MNVDANLSIKRSAGDRGSLSGGYFSLLGLKAEVGADLVEDDRVDGEASYCSYAYWESVFGVDPVSARSST